MKKLWPLVAAVSLISISSIAFADTPPAGSYQQTCDSITFDGSTLNASCKILVPWWHGPYAVTTAIHNSSFGALNNNVGNTNGNLIANGVTPTGNWPNTCLDSIYDVASHTLGAGCKDNIGAVHGTAIIGMPNPGATVNNVNGNLTVSGVTPGGSWINSCSFATYQVPTNSLEANCANDQGYNSTDTQIVNPPSLTEAFNTHGNLTAPGITPGGSWYNTCIGSNYNYPTQTLTASCRDSNGALHSSSIQAAPSDAVFNNNGQLVK